VDFVAKALGKSTWVPFPAALSISLEAARTGDDCRSRGSPKCLESSIAMSKQSVVYVLFRSALGIMCKRWLYWKQGVGMEVLYKEVSECLCPRSMPRSMPPQMVRRSQQSLMTVRSVRPR